MKPSSVEEIMGLLEVYVDSIYDCEHWEDTYHKTFDHYIQQRKDAGEAVESAIRELVAERDAAIKDAKDMSNLANANLRDFRETDAKLGYMEHERNAAQAQVAELRERAGELEKALKGHWWFATDDGQFGCIHCVKAVDHPEDWNGCDEPIDFPHTPDCIITRIGAERE